MARIICRSCGEPRDRCPSNTRYCKECRLLDNAAFWASQSPRNCLNCEQEYRPIERSDAYCGACRHDNPLHEVDCALCDRTAVPPWRTGLKVCLHCAYDPEKRTTLLRALKARRKARIADPDNAARRHHATETGQWVVAASKQPRAAVPPAHEEAPAL